MLKLKRPLIFFDIESTGVDVIKDRIIEVSLVKIFPDGREEMKSFRVNPGISIPAKSTLFHHITDSDVLGLPAFKEIAHDIAAFMEGCDLAGFNSNKFDIPLLAEEFLRADIEFDFLRRKFIDVQTIFHKMEKRTLKAAYQFYCNKNLDEAHSSIADARATYEVLVSQIKKYEGQPYEDNEGNISIPVTGNVDDLAQFSSHTRNVDFAGRFVYDENNAETVNFGKYKGKLLADVLKKEPSFYDWMMKGDFPQNTKKVLTALKIKYLMK